ncbi:MAG: Stp1/IreP family PP2C-type Ser/Thr phosphatase [Gammaproteobacteria bacterium]
MSLKGKIQHFDFTHTGRVREHNEDACAVDIDLGLFVLADGMGGYNAGEIASELAIKTVTDMVNTGLDPERRSRIDESSGLMRQSIVLRNAVSRANKIIWQTAQNNPQCRGMGTTIVACLFHDNRVSIAHVGDSRVYRLRQSRFEQITLDHSLMQELVDRGFFSADEASRSANRNYVTRALGVESSVEVEIQEESARKDDIYVLCSDGLSDMVEDEDIHLTLSTFSANLKTAGEQLVELANQNGGRDNISVCLAQVMESFSESRGPAVSGHHSLVINILNDSFLEDLNSTNGTYVNGKLIRKHALSHGDVVTIGHHQLRFIDSGVDDAEGEFEKTMVMQPDASELERIRSVAAVEDTGTNVQRGAAKLQVLTGVFAGRELELKKAVTTIGRPGMQVAAITRRSDGYNIVMVSSGETSGPPSLNGDPLGPRAQSLNDNDVIEVAGVKMGFFLD